MSQIPQASSKDELLTRLIPFLQEVKDMTASTEIERLLNTKYGVESELYKDLARLITLGVQEGWAADGEVAGPRYRRSQVSLPCADTFFFSITAVLLDSTDNAQDNPEQSFRASYHLHPYGEINLVVPLDEGAALAGPNGWCYGGWTAPAPGSHHFPEVKGGALISLTFLPAGRIAFDVKPPQQ
ncbi:4-hydroxylaminobenzoate lyase [Caballeronia sp. KNU42]